MKYKAGRLEPRGAVLRAVAGRYRARCKAPKDKAQLRVAGFLH